MWKAVVGYEGIYEVSDAGEVRGLDRLSVAGSKLKAKMVAFNSRGGGYLSVHLGNKDGWKKYLVHRLVAQAFIVNPQNKPECNHINGIKTDNDVLNLEWTTHRENIKHANVLGLSQYNKGAKNHKAKLSELEAQYAIWWLNAGMTIVDIAYMLNVSASAISYIKRDVTWKQLARC